MFSMLIGDNPKFKSVLDTAAKVAVSNTSVLITGESGTGKEMLARYIHNNSSRKDNPFIAINMSAIPDNLLENELFGHVAGAYTDAKDDYIGKIGQAGGGTLLLDEIGDMPLSIQAKLLRFMQERVYEPLGSSETVQADVRIISATSRNLYNLLRDGQLREDLYYRFNVVHLRMPALRERADDIVPMATEFAKQCAAQSNKQIVGIDDEVKQFLVMYGWPGNIRQLYNAIESAVVVAEDNVLHLKDFDQNLVHDEAHSNQIVPLKDAIDDFKRSYLTKALQANNWNQKKTAQILQIERTYLNRLIKILKITRS